MIGIALGVMVLITVLSVMNGFDEEIHKRFFGMAPEITVLGTEGKIKDWQSAEKIIAKNPKVIAEAPVVGGQALLVHQGQVLPIVLSGILPADEEKITHLKDKLLPGSTLNLKSFGIVLGRDLADSLGVTNGDKVTIMIPQVTVTPAQMIPRFKRFTIVGIFSAGAGFNFDTKMAFIDLNDAQKLFQLEDNITAIKVRIAKIYDAMAVSKALGLALGEDYQISNWTDQFGAFFQTIKMEKTMMFMILLLIIAVAAFNLVSSLVMVVNDKRSQIAILRTMGATPSLITRIFIVQGMLAGVLGTFTGLVAGIILALNATSIVNFLQGLFNVQLISAKIYFVDYLPSKIMASDLIIICCASLLLCFLATLYPAWRASRTVIVEALHYE